METSGGGLAVIRVGAISGNDSKQVRRTCYDLFCMSACRRSLCTVLWSSSLLWGTNMWRTILWGGSILWAIRRSQGVAACLDEPTVSRERRYLTSRLVRFKLWIQQRLTATKHDDCAWPTTMQDKTRDYSTTLEIRMSLQVFDSVVMKAITLFLPL
jgi:hypothetical protein